MLEILTKAKLVVTADLIINLKRNVIKIGRAEDADQNPLLFRLVDNGHHVEIKNNVFTRCISRVHGEFTWNKQLKRYEYTDLSKYGSWINGKRVHYGKKQVLNNQDKLAVGSEKLEIEIIYS